MHSAVGVALAIASALTLAAASPSATRLRLPADATVSPLRPDHATTGSVTAYNITFVPGREFQGIGAISGGGATSVLLRSYPQEARSQIMDYLFKPGFGASLHICKVEMGGDAQSTDGAESSHMHDPFHEDYSTGYEWWVINEAKRRNPAVKLYGLPWAFPAWVGCDPSGTPDNWWMNCSDNPYKFPEQTARYVVKWAVALRDRHGHVLDYVGLWNERAYNIEYIGVLRRGLDNAGLTMTKIVAPDSVDAWKFGHLFADHPQLYEQVAALGYHYPGTRSTPYVRAMGVPLWASEEGSVYNDNIGAGCMARTLVQNYAFAEVTATIYWNLVSSYQKGTNWYRNGLMTAVAPWTGTYGTWRADGSWSAGPMVWAMAHTTQFVVPDGDWIFLQRGAGAGSLRLGGSYATYVNPRTKQFTITMEKMTFEHSRCVRPWEAKWNTSAETVVITLDPVLVAWARAAMPPYTAVDQVYLSAVVSQWSFDETRPHTREFERVQPVSIDTEGRIAVRMGLDAVVTLTTQHHRGTKGTFGVPTTIPRMFPRSYTTDFQNCRASEEANYFSDQAGIWECHPATDDNTNMVMRQMVPMKPIGWAGDIRPHSFIGHPDAVDSAMSIRVKIDAPGHGMHLGARVYGQKTSRGLLMAVTAADGPQPSTWMLFTSEVSVGDSKKAFAKGTTNPNVSAGVWYSYALKVTGTFLTFSIDGQQQVSIDISRAMTPGTLHSGYSLIGTTSFGQFVEFDNLELQLEYNRPCVRNPLAPAAYVTLRAVECSSEVGQVASTQYYFNGHGDRYPGTITARVNGSLCVTTNAEAKPVVLSPCVAGDSAQQWEWNYTGFTQDDEKGTYISNPASGLCLSTIDSARHIGAGITVAKCDSGDLAQRWFVDRDGAGVMNIALVFCVGQCLRE